MNFVTEDIKDMLTDESSLGLTFGTDLFIAHEPESPDNCVTLYDTSGGRPDLSLQGGNYHRDTFQIRVRNNGYAEAMAEVYRIMDFLQGKANEIWNGTYYSLIYVYIPPFGLEWDDNNRAVVVLNMEAQRR